MRDRVIAEHESPSAAINPLGSDAVQTFGGFNGIGGPSVVIRARKVAPSIVSVEGVGTGSGVVVSSNGVVITSADLVGSLSEVQVTFEDGSTAFATNLGADPATRVAVLDVPDERLDSADLKAPDATTMGKTVVLAGKGGDGQLRTALGTLESSRPDKAFGEVSSGMLQIATDDQDLAADLQGAAVLDASGAVLGLATWSDDERFYIAPIDVARNVASDMLTVAPSPSD